jgi:hypothetical protein
MTAGGGGVSIPISFVISQARSALDALRSAGQSTASGINAAFQSANVQIGGLTQATDQMKSAAKAADDLKSKGEIRVVLRGEGIAQVQAAFEATARAGQDLAGKKFTVQIGINEQTLAADIAAVRSQLSGATKGQNLQLDLRVSPDKATEALHALEEDFKRAEAKGVHIAVTLDTAGAARDADRATREAQQKADAAKRTSDQAAAKAARDAQAFTNQVRINVTLSGAETTAAQLRKLLDDAHALNGAAHFTIDADGKNIDREVERVRQLLQGMNKGDSATVNLKMKAEDAKRVTNAVAKDIDDLRQRGGNISLNINPQSVSRAQGLIQQTLSGAGRGLVAGSGIGGNLLIGANFTAGAAASLGAAVAVQALTQAIISSSQASLEYNKNLELTRNTFEVLTGSATKAQSAMAGLRKLAAQSPLSEQQTLETGAGFLRVSGGDVQRMQQLTELTSALASAKPDLPFERIRSAMQQLVSGDFAAFDDIVNNATGTTRQFAQQGFSGMELYRKAVEAAGASIALMDRNTNSFSVRLSNFQQAAEGINAAFGRGLFENLSESIGSANKVLSDHQATWEKVAEAAGRALTTGAALGAQVIGFPGLDKTLKGLEAVAVLLEKIERASKPPAVVEQEDARTSQRSTLNTQRETATGSLAVEKQNLAEIERQLRANKTAQDEIKAGYEAQLIPLQQQLAEINRINGELVKQGLLAQRAQVEASQKREESLGPPEARADLAGAKFTLDLQHEILDIQQRRAEREEAIGELEQTIAQRGKQEEAERAKLVLDALKEEVRARQEARQVALEALREEIRARQEARQVALEAIREEMRARQEARQVALEAMREEMRTRSEARQAALDSLRDEVRARQEARREALDALREEIRGRQEARQVALEAIQEEIRARREAYDVALQQQRDLAEDAERNYQDAERAADNAHRRSQERYQDQIQQLRDRDQRLSRQDQGPSEAEKELKDLEAASRERQRLVSLADAEAAVYNANTGRERREAQRRLAELRTQQDEERKKEALQAQADAEKAARDKAAQKRQDDIAALERKAQDEDRKYQREKEDRDEKHRQQQEAIAAQQRTEERAEAQRRREEDAQVRAQEKKDKDAEKAEAAQIRAAEKADRDQQRAEEAQVRAAEEAARKAEQADQAKLRAQEQKDREAERADQDKVRAQEAADRAAERADQQKERQAEAAQKAADRAEDAEIRRQEAAQRAADAAIAIQKKKDDDARDLLHLERLKAMKVIEDQIDENRLKSISLINQSLGAQAEHDAVIADHLATVAANLQKLNDIDKALRSNDIKVKIEAIQIEMGAKLVDLEKARLELEGHLNAVQGKIDGLNRQIEEINRAITKIGQPGEGDQPSGVGPPKPPEDPQVVLARAAALFNEWMQKTWPQIIGDGIVNILGWLAKGAIDWWTTDTKTAQAAKDWVDKSMKTPMENLLEVSSPSELSKRWAGWIADGFVNGLTPRTQEIAELLETPFIAFQDEYMPAFTSKFEGQVKELNDVLQTNWDVQAVAELLETPFIDFEDKYMPAFEAKLYTQLDGILTQVQSKWAQGSIAANLEAPFIEFQELYMPAFIERLRAQGDEAAQAFVDAWVAFKIDTKLTINVPSGFVEFGKKAGEAFCRGWQASMTACPCPTCAAPPTQNPKQNQNPKYVTGSLPTGLNPPRRVGDALPVSVLNVGPSVAGARNSTPVGPGTNVGGSVSVQVHNTINASEGMDVEELSNRVTAKTIDKVIDILDYTQRTSPNPVSRTQPGAL